MGIKPNTAIIIVISIAFMRGEYEGALTGFIAGFLQDSFFGFFLGMHIFISMTIGFIVGKFLRGFYKDSILIPLIVTVCADFVYQFVYYAFNILLRGYTNLFYFLHRIILPEIVYTAIFAVFMYKLLYIINDKIEEKEKYRRKLF